MHDKPKINSENLIDYSQPLKQEDIPNVLDKDAAKTKTRSKRKKGKAEAAR